MTRYTKISIGVILMWIMPTISLAQPRVKNLDAFESGQSITLTYDLTEEADISIYVSQDAGKSYRKISAKYLSGDCGARINAGKHCKVLWHVLNENGNDEYHGYAKFRIKAIPSFNPFVLATGAISGPKDWSVGIMAGMVGMAGFYVKGSTNFVGNKSYDYSCDKNGTISYQGDLVTPFYTGNKSLSNWMVTGGAVVRLYIPLYLYLGGGYGQHNLYWETENGFWVYNTEGTSRGFTGDIGLMGNIKHFAVSIGVTSIGFKNTEFCLGIGYKL